jgi:probable aminopeptidase NPEPL1
LTAAHSKRGTNGEPPEKKSKVEDSTDDSASLILGVLNCMQPSGDSAASTELWVPGLLRVVLVMLPRSETVSRHNAPGNPHAVSGTLKKYVRPKESTAVVSLVESDTEITCTLCAIARIGGGLLYNRKTGTGDPGTPSSESHHSHPSAPLLLGGVSMSETALPDLNHLRVLFRSPDEMDPADHEWQSRLGTLALGVQLARRLVDAPCNELDTSAFLEQAKAVVHGLKHVSTKVIQGKELEAKGYGGIFGVGKAGECVDCE